MTPAWTAVAVAAAAVAAAGVVAYSIAVVRLILHIRGI